MILVFGSVNVDLVARVEAIARPGETVLAPGYERFFGGKGANQAVAAARACAPGTPPVIFCGAVGADAFGRDSVASLAREGIDVSLMQSVEDSTGCAFISVDRAGENAITVASGANAKLQVPPLGDAQLAETRVLVLQMEAPWRSSAALAARAARAGVHVVLNFAPAPAGFDPTALRALLADVDTLVVNEHELATLVATLRSAHGLQDGAATSLARELGLRVAVTLGARGVLLAEDGRPEWHCPARPSAVADTTGAGDTFVGVLAVGIAEGLDPRAAALRAVDAASLSCEHAGARAGMPGRDAIDRAATARSDMPEESISMT